MIYMQYNIKKKSLIKIVLIFNYQRFMSGAVNGTRTRDPRLGKPMLYQLSYYRNLVEIEDFHLSDVGDANLTILFQSGKKCRNDLSRLIGINLDKSR